MLQTLLAERIGLACHREKQEMQIYALSVGKPGRRFHDPPGPAPKFDPRQVGPRQAHFRDLNDLAIFLSRYLRRVEPAGDPRAWFLEAVLSQLGLKIEPVRDLVEVIVIDRSIRRLPTGTSRRIAAA